MLCERGDISFYDKVTNVQTGGGVGAIIFNNEPGNFLGTLGEGESSEIIGVSLSQEDGLYLFANQLGNTGTISSEFIWPISSYEHYDGTSMATPHVAAVAALIWSQVPGATASEIRTAISSTALDLGDPGLDNAFGYGLVQAADALAYLEAAPVNELMVVSVSTDQPSYIRGTTATITVDAADEYGSAIAGASVTVSITDARSRVTMLTGTTDSSGTAVFTYVTHNKTGANTIDAVVSQTGFFDGFGSITVLVTK